MKTLEEVKAKNIKIPKLPKEVLVDEACQHFNEFKGEHPDFIPASPNSDSAFLYRIIHNYIRHELTDYEEHLEHLYRKIGKEDAYYFLKEKIRDKIDQTYPWLITWKPE